MALRQLTDIERERLKRLTAESIDVTLIQPTRTGLEKSILDATAPVRSYLRANKIHDYSEQGQGPENRVYVNAEFMSESLLVPSRASLYRPVTKKGDPRIWFTALGDYAKPDDIVAIATYEGKLVLINLTQVDIARVLDELRQGALWEIIQEIKRDANAVSQELLDLLRALASRGLVPSVMDGPADTAIGRTLETALGIQMNSNRTPDYKGIELKSYRRGRTKSRENRKNLFAQVPNWELSKFKSSTEILNNFGYQRGADFKLYCTVSALRPNSQGLYLKFANSGEQLDERSSKAEIGAFASWLLTDLRHLLLKKHKETFWISAKANVADGKEYFDFIDVRHTRGPIASQFDILLEQGEITVDHLIKRTPSGGSKEKGPLFKLNSAALDLLFPPSVTYELQ